MNPDSNKRPTEDRIDAALAALRHAEPAPGMEQRITAALLREDAAAKPSRWISPRVPQLAGLAAVLVAGVLLSVHIHRRHDSVSVQDRAAIPAGPAVQLNHFTPSHQNAKAPSAAATAHATAIEVSRLTPPGRAQTAKPPLPEKPPWVEQAKAEQGFPAPPLPLTEQERLLVRLIHRDDPVQLAQLTPAAREANLQRDREQVREFFKPPPMLAANFTLEPYPTTGGTQ